MTAGMSVAVAGGVGDGCQVGTAVNVAGSIPQGVGVRVGESGKTASGKSVGKGWMFAGTQPASKME